ncbi:MAG TPA: hypothetical protein VED65_00710 [Candidatus Bathyarchaeia archaeon]|nr:hypothetical protein [Candidatus Bathyarchaeia archaeon]
MFGAIFFARSLRHVFSLYLFLALVVFPTQAKWKYLRDGNAADFTVTPRAGFALMLKPANIICLSLKELFKQTIAAPGKFTETIASVIKPDRPIVVRVH